MILNQDLAFQTGTTLLYFTYSKAIDYLFASCATIDYVKDPLGEVCATKILFSCFGIFGLVDSTLMILNNQFSLSLQNNSFVQNLFTGASANATSILNNTMSIGCLWSFMKITDVFHPAVRFLTCLASCILLDVSKKLLIQGY